MAEAVPFPKTSRQLNAGEAVPFPKPQLNAGEAVPCPKPIRVRQNIASVAFPFEVYFALEHAEQQGEVAERENHPQEPPSEANRQAMLARGWVVDGQVTGGIGAGGKHHGKK